ncbi:hypothetical protein SAMD00019534_029580 [Acytostelium subglobosum LB1]|uniref:hypothetical protein n=1 Tax=Acytostelium subglobosum LB1 TaxID=1410327 RepID=UPI0006451262|nr:hypothetical protein SAMD00019534_029580 [Acytostelium subglobosum LB1]GAM19783.1 hypothetical protein SAMD00019534_029580 [Acytostelium subglobosum LB1]|eukprot:XP_012756545.1 hypothetical protein SAMD00019534_029580 [Acytostelium subglobosum LB1]
MVDIQADIAQSSSDGLATRSRLCGSGPASNSEQNNGALGLGLVDRKLFKQKINGLLIGQLISLCICGTGVFSQLLSMNYNINIPTAQSLLNYILLSFYSIILWRRGTLWHSLRTKSIFLLPLALFDVEANYVAVKAYQYTTITSVMLLDCFTIPCVAVLTRIFLKTRYTLIQIVAIVISMAGLVILVISDILQGQDANGGSNPLLGDMLVLVASVLYAISNVGQEYTVKSYDNETYLAIIGIYGTIISSIQLAIFERNELRTMVWSGPVIGYIVGFAICLFTMYSITPFMMRIAGATLMNLSLLTSDIFSVVVAIFLFHRRLDWLYFMSFFVIVSGLVIYNLSQPHPKSLLLPNLEGLDNNDESSAAEDDDEGEDPLIISTYNGTPPLSHRNVPAAILHLQDEVVNNVNDDEDASSSSSDIRTNLIGNKQQQYHQT